MNLTRVVRVLVLALILAPIVVLILGYRTPVKAHEAASGWSYDPNCCNTMDCAQVDVATVRITASGYEVTLRPGDHFRVFVSRVYLVPLDDARIRRSGDEHYHACIGSPHYAADPQRLICLYVPDMLG